MMNGVQLVLLTKPFPFTMTPYLLTRSLSSSGLAGGLLGAGHFE